MSGKITICDIKQVKGICFFPPQTHFVLSSDFSVAQFRTIYGSFVLRASLPHSLHYSHNNQLFPCIALKFPTHFMVTLNDLIICLHISKPDFSPTNSFPWKPKGDSIKTASELMWVIKKRKVLVSIKTSYRLHTEGNSL